MNVEVQFAIVAAGVNFINVKRTNFRENDVLFRTFHVDEIDTRSGEAEFLLELGPSLSSGSK